MVRMARPVLQQNTAKKKVFRGKGVAEFTVYAEGRPLG